MNYINTFFNDLLNLFYPRICPGCGNDLAGTEKLLCLACMGSLPLTHFHLIPGNPVERMLWGRLPVIFATSYAWFAKSSIIQNLLHDMKYRGNKEIGLYFGRRMGDAFITTEWFRDVNMLVPVPLFAGRERTRGFNQSALLCQGMHEVTGKPLMPGVVRRLRNNATQTKKGRTERWMNTEGNFVLKDADAIAGKHVLLVDDVMTTGATIEACGSALLKADNTRISIATLAYTAI